jgi:hypothetical protein
MVTDAALGGARTGTVIPYGARLGVTILLLGLYWFAYRVPLPFIDQEAFLEASLLVSMPMQMTILALGLTPLLTGFILVELFSLLTSPGRRLRKAGAAGRGRLNRAGLMTSLILAAIQAAGIALYLESMASPGGAPLVPNPGLAFKLLMIVTLTAVTAALFTMGKLLSGYGIGNGFALLTLADLGRAVASGFGGTGEGASPDLGITGPGLGWLLAAAIVFLLFRFLQRADDAWLPAFPQGVLPAAWSLTVTAFLVRLSPGLGDSLSLGDFQLAGPAFTLIAVPLLSLITFHLFSSRGRLQANLPEPEEVLDELAPALRRQGTLAAAVLAVGTAALLAWRENAPSALSLSLDFVSLVTAAAVVLDLWDQYRFQRRYGPWEQLVQLDNVHFSYRLEERLQEAGIGALARGHRLRSLLFFLGPLFKIDMLVAREQLDRARAVLAELEAAPEIKVF